MRLVFADPESGEVPLRPGALTLGASGECDIPLGGAGWLPHHASIIVDPQRGLWLQLEPGAAMAHVNARPVRECAMLRAGDIVSLGSVQFSICLGLGEELSVEQLPPLRNNAEHAAKADTAERVAATRAVLRGISGLYHGRTFPLVDDVLLGSGAGVPIRIEAPGIAAQHSRFELHRDRIVLRAEAPGNVLKVNGMPVENTILHPGDQITVDQHRFVVEAPGLPPRGVGSFRPRQRPITQAVPPPARTEAESADAAATSTPQPPARPESRFHAWWLLVAATAIALVLAAILLYGPR